MADSLSDSDAHQENAHQEKLWLAARRETAPHGDLFPVEMLIRPLQDPEPLHLSDAPPFSGLSDADIQIRDLLQNASAAIEGNEAETIQELIRPILTLLGWVEPGDGCNLNNAHGGRDVPDFLLYATVEARALGQELSDPPSRWQYAAALLEAKHANRALGQGGKDGAPDAQILHYLRIAAAIQRKDGASRPDFGILTNGRVWRLYHHVEIAADQAFVEFDLRVLLNPAPNPAHDQASIQMRDAVVAHWLRQFRVLFSPWSFRGRVGDRPLDRWLERAKSQRARLAEDLDNQVFEQAYPKLIAALYDSGLALDRIQEAALIFLYRLLFLLYAEDRDLLPVFDPFYKKISLRALRMELQILGTGEGNQIWRRYMHLCKAIREGSEELRVPPYNGALFAHGAHEVSSLPDHQLADIIRLLSETQSETDRGAYINFRDLSVRQLGGMYERLLEFRPELDAAGKIRTGLVPNARKLSGSYYTPDALVYLTVDETLTPLAEEAEQAFEKALQTAKTRDGLQKFDPAAVLLRLKICDPAMGSGHFLVAAIDWLSNRAARAVLWAEETAFAHKRWTEKAYVSPLAAMIAGMRAQLLQRARDEGWDVNPKQLDDRQILRRMILKACIYGVDKNPRAVELAKLSLWLHSFTIGAPLSFLDHHIQAGDALVGGWVAAVNRELAGDLFWRDSIRGAMATAKGMEQIAALPDLHLDQVKKSENIWQEVQENVAPLSKLLSQATGLAWLQAGVKPKSPQAENIKSKINIWNAMRDQNRAADSDAEHALLAELHDLAMTERFFHWQTAFPEIWQEWTSNIRVGGFDAILSNPPWEQVKIKQSEWFQHRLPQLASAGRAAKRKRAIEQLADDNPALDQEYHTAQLRSERMRGFARAAKEYPFLSKGDMDYFALMVERAYALLKPNGIAGLITPSILATGATAAPFFRQLTLNGRLKALYDFENRRSRYKLPAFFPAVHQQFRFMITIAGAPDRHFPHARLAAMLQATDEAASPAHHYNLTADEMRRFSPNTGSPLLMANPASIAIMHRIYQQGQIFHQQGRDKPYNLTYCTLLHMGNDSHKFHTAEELKQKNGFQITGGRWQIGTMIYQPLQTGKTIFQFDHRHASVRANPDRMHNQNVGITHSDDEKSDPTFSPTPLYWVAEADYQWPSPRQWALSFRNISGNSNERTMIAAIIPANPCGDKLPLLYDGGGAISVLEQLALLAQFNALPFDFAARQRLSGTGMNFFIVAQLPVITPQILRRQIWGGFTALDLLADAAFRLSYTAHDLAALAIDYADERRHNPLIQPIPQDPICYNPTKSDLAPCDPIPCDPIIWDREMRVNLRAKIDAILILLWDLEPDCETLFKAFPINPNARTNRCQRLTQNWLNALKANQPFAPIA